MVLTRAQVNRLRPMNEPQVPFIDQLSDEELLYIFDMLNAIQRSDVVTASCVCARWHSLAQRVIDNHIGPLSINNKDRDKNAILFRRLRTDGALQSRVNHIHVGNWTMTSADFQRPDSAFRRRANPYAPHGFFSDNWSGTSRRQAATWKQIRSLAYCIRKLKVVSFTWSAMPALPIPLAEALSAQTSCKVNICMHEGSLDYATILYTPYLNPTTLHDIAPVQSTLAKLEILIPAGDAKLFRQLGTIVRSAENLRTLKVYAVGRMWFEHQTPDAHIGTVLDRFTTARNMNWLFPTTGNDNLKPLRLTGMELTNFCVCEAAALNDTWTASVAWDHLRKVGLSCTTMLRLIQDKRPNLTGLELTLSSDRDCEYSMCPSRLTPIELGDILQQQPTLQDLALINSTELITPQLIKRLPPTIRRLSTHEISSPIDCNNPSTRPCLGARTLQLLAHQLPSLTELVLDTPFPNSEYLAYLRFTLTLFPRLQHLTAYREAEKPRYNAKTDPARGSITYSTVARDFTRYFSPIAPALQTLTVRVSSISPFDRDVWYHERGGIDCIYQDVDPTTFIVRRGAELNVHCEEVEMAKALARDGDEYFEKELIRRKDLAENCWRYKYDVELERYLTEPLCTGGVDPDTGIHYMDLPNWA